MTTFDQKYDIVLKFLNKILINIGKPEISQLEQFVGIDREDIIKDENKAIVKEMEEEFFGPFDKKTTRFYKRNLVQNYILTLMRKIIDDVGYNFTFVRKEMRSNNRMKNHNFYSITKKE